jgi:hypothetical protein
MARAQPPERCFDLSPRLVKVFGIGDNGRNLSGADSLAINKQPHLVVEIAGDVEKPLLVDMGDIQ